jgi:hypothetical protein
MGTVHSPKSTSITPDHKPLTFSFVLGGLKLLELEPSMINSPQNQKNLKLKLQINAKELYLNAVS